MWKIYEFDSNKRIEKNSDRGPFSLNRDNTFSLIRNKFKSKVIDLLEKRKTLSKEYDFNNPDKIKWNIWKNYFMDFIIELWMMISDQDEEFSIDEVAKDEFLKAWAYLLNFFEKLYFMDEVWFEIINAQYKTINDDQIKIDSFLYDILQNGTFISSEEFVILSDMPKYMQDKISILESQYKNLTKKRNNSVYRFVWEYINIFIVNIWKCEQVNALLTAVWYYWQKLLDSYPNLDDIEDEDRN